MAYADIISIYLHVQISQKSPIMKILVRCQFCLLTLIYRFSQAWKRNSHFFFRTSQGHNALPRPGLESGSSDSEPSALTTGQSCGVDVPAVQLTTHVKSSTLYGRTVVRSYILIFSAWWVTTFIIMELCSASPAIN